ncbi:MAG: GntR family transcriptional regulator [Rhodospirillaceae bacterium]|nr:GntR family transcriptional regulator [Rhodospirillaceae bacterium]
MPSASLPPRQSHLDLADRLVDEIRQAGTRIGDHLPEQWVASRCAVSRTLARAALGVLEGEGAVAFRPGRGYVLSADPVALREARSQSGAQSGAGEDLRTRILRDRVARRLSEQVTIPELMRRYGEARPPVAKTLARLAEDRLVERGAGQRWHFRPMLDGPSALADSYRYRLLAEPACLLEPGFTADRPRLADLRARMDQLLLAADAGFDTALFDEVDRAFHETLAEGCANRFLRSDLLDHLKMRRAPSFQSPAPVNRLRESTREHLRVLEQVERGRMEAAADLMRVHLQLSQPSWPTLSVRGAPPLVGPSGAPRGLR